MATNAQGGDSDMRPRSCLYTNLAKDVVSVVTVGILLVCIHDLASPFVRGFNCDDETIRYPYKESTVSSGVCYFIGSGLNVGLILLLEYLNLVAQPESDRDQNLGGFETKLYLRNVYCRLIIWLFGAISSELMTDITKVTAGRLRPHFISVCKPIILNGSVEIPLDQYCAITSNRYEYITNYYCSGVSSKQRDARLSFLSGHSSYSAYSATFAVIYIHSMLDIKRLGLIKPALQVLIISAALYTGLSRISDYKHHWQDVLAGLTLGTTVAAFVNAFLWPPLYRIYSKLLWPKTPQPEQDQRGEELNRFSY